MSKQKHTKVENTFQGWKNMKPIMQISHCKSGKGIANLLMISLVLWAFTLTDGRAAKPPSGPVYCGVAAVYPAELVFTASPLVHSISGQAGPNVILWPPGKAYVRLNNYRLGDQTELTVALIKNAAGQVVSVQVGATAGVPFSGDWRWHDTPVLPVLNGPVTVDNVNGYTLQIQKDLIPVYRHTKYHANSPVEGIAGYMSLGDFVMTPIP